MNRQSEFTNKGRYSAICKSADLGPEFDPTDKSKYKVVFTCINLDGLDPDDPTTWKLTILGIKQFGEGDSAHITLTEEQAKPMILGGIAVDERASRVFCFVVENMPDGLVSEGDVVYFEDLVPLVPYVTKARQYNTPMIVQSRISTAGGVVKTCEQGVTLGEWIAGDEIAGLNVVTLDPSDTYSLALTWATLTANVPDTLQCKNIIVVNGTTFTIRVDFPFFTPTQG